MDDEAQPPIPQRWNRTRRSSPAGPHGARSAACFTRATPGVTPPLIVPGEDAVDLRDQIIRAEARIAARSCSMASMVLASRISAAAGSL